MRSMGARSEFRGKANRYAGKAATVASGAGEGKRPNRNGSFRQWAVVRTDRVGCLRVAPLCAAREQVKVARYSKADDRETLQ